METRQQDKNTPLKDVTYFIGVVLVIGSALILVFILILLVQLIQSPTDSALIAWVNTTFDDTVVLITGHINETPIEFRVNDKLQFLLLSILGFVSIGIVAGVIKVLLMAGVQLIKFSKTSQ
ncbi:MAG: hypothetical protein ABW098_20645 [Candidatus Thiodiazotropha sp.]